MLSILSGVSRSKASSRRGASKIASADPKCSRRRAVTRGPTPGVMLRAIQSFIADFRLPIADLHHCPLPISSPPGAQNCSGQVTSPIGNWQSAIGDALAEACRNRTYLSLLSQSH
ncbi:MAG: hypothetical protein DMF76_10385 [Acidobacteria bacterium]|nr:MAG: hypothetical protein DMF76_10385 [Acidobacteriota bacterium]